MIVNQLNKPPFSQSNNAPINNYTVNMPAAQRTNSSNNNQNANNSSNLQPAQNINTNSTYSTGPRVAHR